MSRVAVLSNPASGGNRAGGGRQLDRVRRLARDAEAIHVESRGSEELPRLLSDLARRDVGLLVVNGGDGTVIGVVTALLDQRPFRSLPLLAVLSGGTTNMIAADVGPRGRPPAALRRLLAAHAAGTLATRPRRPLQVRQAGQSDRYGFFLSAAAIPRVSAAAQRHLHGRGLTGAAGWTMALGWSFMRLIGGRIGDDPLLRPEPATLALDGVRADPQEVVLVLATTLDRLLLGMTPAPPGGGIGVAAMRSPYRGLWWRLPGLLRGSGGDWSDAGYLRARAQEVELETAAPCVLDGEALPAAAPSRLRLGCGPALTFARA